MNGTGSSSGVKRDVDDDRDESLRKGGGLDEVDQLKIEDKVFESKLVKEVLRKERGSIQSRNEKRVGGNETMTVTS